MTDFKLYIEGIQMDNYNLQFAKEQILNGWVVLEKQYVSIQRFMKLRTNFYSSALFLLQSYCDICTVLQSTYNTSISF